MTKLGEVQLSARHLLMLHSGIANATKYVFLIFKMGVTLYAEVNRHENVLYYTHIP